MTWKLPEGTQLVLVDNPFIPRVDTGSSCRDCEFFRKHDDYKETGDGDCLDEYNGNPSEQYGFENGCLLPDSKKWKSRIFKLQPIL